MLATLKNNGSYVTAFAVADKQFASGNAGLFGNQYIAAHFGRVNLTLTDAAGSVVVDCPLPAKQFSSGKGGYFLSETIATEDGLYRLQCQLVKQGKGRYRAQVLLLAA